MTELNLSPTAEAWLNLKSVEYRPFAASDPAGQAAITEFPLQGLDLLLDIGCFTESCWGYDYHAVASSHWISRRAEREEGWTARKGQLMSRRAQAIKLAARRQRLCDYVLCCVGRIRRRDQGPTAGAAGQNGARLELPIGCGLRPRDHDRIGRRARDRQPRRDGNLRNAHIIHIPRIRRGIGGRPRRKAHRKIVAGGTGRHGVCIRLVLGRAIASDGAQSQPGKGTGVEILNLK